MRRTAKCPHCEREIIIYATTTKEQARAGLVYLMTRCQCGARIDAAGIGQEDADRDMDKRIERRRGTPLERWTIRPRRTGKFRGRRYSHQRT